MSELNSGLDRLETDFAEAFECYGDGRNLSIAIFPFPDDTLEIGPVQIESGSIPLDSLPGTTWAEQYGVALVTDHSGTGHKIIAFVGGSSYSAEPRQVFERLARRAGAMCFRLPRGMTATGPGNAADMNWIGTLYTYLKGTAFVVEGAGYSRIRSLFAASTEVISLIRRGDAAGQAPTFAGSLRPGLPGVESTADFRLIALPPEEGPVAPAGLAVPNVQVQTGDAPNPQPATTSAPANGANAPPPPPPVIPTDDPFASLRALIKTLRLKGKERDTIEMLCDRQGTVEISVLAMHFSWEYPTDNWGSMRKRLNKKVRKHGWQLSTNDNCASAEPLVRSGPKQVEPSGRK